MGETHKLDYSREKSRAGHSSYGVASAFVGLTTILFGVFVIVVDDPFESMGNRKPIRICTVAGILGILLAFRAMFDPDRKQILAQIGLVLNVLAIPATWLFLPCT